MSGSTSGAIVLGLGLGGAFIGLGLFFGLRARGEGATGAPAPSASSVAAESLAPGPSGPATSPPASAATSATRAPEGAPNDARRAVEAQHAHLVEACWVPSVARNPLPAQVALTITLEYGPEGRLLIHSLQPNLDGKRGARADVTMCVNRELVLPTTVSPPGRRVRMAVAIEFP